MAGKRIAKQIPESLRDGSFLDQLYQKLPNLPPIRCGLIGQLKLLKLMPFMIDLRSIGPGMELGGASVKKQAGGLF